MKFWFPEKFPKLIPKNDFGIFFFNFWIQNFDDSNLPNILTLIQPGKGRFTLAYMSHDYLHGSHAGLPGWMRVNKHTAGPSQFFCKECQMYFNHPIL